MTTLSVPLTTRIEEFIKSYIEEGKAETKAEVARMALLYFEKENAVNRVLKAQKEALEGKFFTGDIDKLAKKLK